MTIRSDTVANIAMSFMCVVTTYAVVQHLIVPRFLPPAAAGAAGYQPGDTLTEAMEQMRLDGAALSAVVVLSSNCGFCNQSADFYRRLAALRTPSPERPFKTVFVGMSGRDDAAAFVKAHGLPADLIRPSPRDVLARVPGTPTLVLVDGKGRVTSSWIGKLTEAQENEVLQAVSDGLKGN